MNLDFNRFKVVVIDYPIYLLKNSIAHNILTKSLDMKLEGYHSTYSENVFPFDKADFFGTHLIFGEIGENDSFIPIFAYKSTPLDRCLKYHFEFPAFSSVKNDGDISLMSSIQKIIDEAKDSKLVSFDSAWAQNIKYRFSDNAELKAKLREIMMMVIVNHHREYNIPHMITCGVVKVKTDQFFLRIGLNKINSNAHYNQKCMDNEELVLFYNQYFSDEALFNAEKYSALWDNKYYFNGLEEHLAQKKKSA